MRGPARTAFGVGGRDEYRSYVRVVDLGADLRHDVASQRAENDSAG